MDTGPESSPSPSSGDLATDLARELQRLQRILNDSPFVPQLLTLLGRAEWDPPLRDLKRRLLSRGIGGLRQALEDASARGDLTPPPDIDAVIARLAGPLFYRRLLADGTIDDAFVSTVIAEVTRDDSIRGDAT